MRVGVVQEIKRHEYRVGLTPSGVQALVGIGAEVLVQRGAGAGSGFEDTAYVRAGATLAESAEQVFARADMIVKVKEPQPVEVGMMRPGQILFTYLHLAADAELTRGLMDSGATCIAYETMELEDGSLPCLRPMSEIAGRLSIQEGAKCLERPSGGRGVLLAGVPGVQRGKVAILGAGVAGVNACKMAVGMGAEVTVLDVRQDRLAFVDDLFDGHVTTLHSNAATIESVLPQSDLVVGAVLVTGAKAPKIIRREHLKRMKPGSVIVDIAVDQGGCAETTRPTTHDEPTYVVDGVIHYCVANMPGAVALTSTEALTSTTLPYVLLLAEHGWQEACRLSRPLELGLNIVNGHCVNESVATAHGIDA